MPAPSRGCASAVFSRRRSHNILLAPLHEPAACTWLRIGHQFSRCVPPPSPCVHSLAAGDRSVGSDAAGKSSAASGRPLPQCPTLQATRMAGPAQKRLASIHITAIPKKREQLVDCGRCSLTELLKAPRVGDGGGGSCCSGGVSIGADSDRADSDRAEAPGGGSASRGAWHITRSAAPGALGVRFGDSPARRCCVRIHNRGGNATGSVHARALSGAGNTTVGILQ